MELGRKVGDMIGSEFPKDAEGRVYHLQVKNGEVANRILLVGDLERAKIIKECFDANTCVEYPSTRGFMTYTGKRNGINVTVMGMGMEYPMMDFAVRIKTLLNALILFILTQPLFKWRPFIFFI